MSDLADLGRRFEELKKQNLKLDMTRGKPCPQQLDLSMEMLTAAPGNYKAADGTDCRNYGGLDGLPEAKRLFADMIDVASEQVIIGGNASLNLMHDTMVRLMLKGAGDGATPWCKLPKVKFLCPAPGYDRHFSILAYLGIEMVIVGMNADGPDMDAVEKLAGADESVKGMICVPRYSNPTGITYSADVVRRVAAMKTAAEDFRVIWDERTFSRPASRPGTRSGCSSSARPRR
jgi:DNA-binding transcriptional MocR family regulator